MLSRQTVGTFGGSALARGARLQEAPQTHRNTQKQGAPPLTRLLGKAAMRALSGMTSSTRSSASGPRVASPPACGWWWRRRSSEESRVSGRNYTCGISAAAPVIAAAQDPRLQGGAIAGPSRLFRDEAHWRDFVQQSCCGQLERILSSRFSTGNIQYVTHYLALTIVASIESALHVVRAPMRTLPLGCLLIGRIQPYAPICRADTQTHSATRAGPPA
jgi:hypothetical protein